MSAFDYYSRQQSIETRGQSGQQSDRMEEPNEEILECNYLLLVGRQTGARAAHQKTYPFLRFDLFDQHIFV